MDETELTTVALSVGRQAIVCYLGDDLPPLVIDDQMTAGDLQDYVRTPLARAALVARLRTIAAMLEDPLAPIVDRMTASVDV